MELMRIRRPRALCLLALLSTQAGYAGPDPIELELNPSDFLPLAVGNRWTYEHSYYNGSYPWGDWSEGGPEWLKPLEIPGYPHGGDRDSWPPDSLTTATRTLTIQITHTETIDGLEYFAFSGANYSWPPLPEFFWGGKKVRVSAEGFLLFRSKGQDVPLYDFGHPHTFADPNAYTYVTHGYAVELPADPSTAYRQVAVQRGMHLYDDGLRIHGSESFPLYDLSQVFFRLEPSETLQRFYYCGFLQGYGMGRFDIMVLGISWSPLFYVQLTPMSANIQDEEIPYPEHEHMLPGPFSSSSVQSTSWGHVKRSVLHTTGGR